MRLAASVQRNRCAGADAPAARHYRRRGVVAAGLDGQHHEAPPGHRWRASPRLAQRASAAVRQEHAPPHRRRDGARRPHRVGRRPRGCECAGERWGRAPEPAACDVTRFQAVPGGSRRFRRRQPPAGDADDPRRRQPPAGDAGGPRDSRVGSARGRVVHALCVCSAGGSERVRCVSHSRWFLLRLGSGAASSGELCSRRRPRLCSARLAACGRSTWGPFVLVCRKSVSSSVSGLAHQMSPDFCPPKKVPPRTARQFHVAKFCPQSSRICRVSSVG